MYAAKGAAKDVREHGLMGCGERGRESKPSLLHVEGQQRGDLAMGPVRSFTPEGSGASESSRARAEAGYAARLNREASCRPESADGRTALVNACAVAARSCGLLVIVGRREYVGAARRC
jgi:hypothetical protein